MNSTFQNQSGPQQNHSEKFTSRHKRRINSSSKKGFLSTTFTYIIVISVTFWFFSIFVFEQRIHDEYMLKQTKSLFSNRELIHQLYLTQNVGRGTRNEHSNDDDGLDVADVDDGNDLDDKFIQDPTTYLTMYGRHRFNDSFYKLPKWLQTYFRWHKKQTSNANSETKYAVLTCLPEDDCGGLSDRIRPLPFLLMVAKRTNRVLCFYWRKNYGLEEFLQPIEGLGIEWRCPNDIDDYFDLSKKAKRQPKVKNFKFIYCKKGKIPFAPCVESDIRRMRDEKKFKEGRYVSIAMYTREPIRINLANELVHRHSYGGVGGLDRKGELITNSSEYLMPGLVNWEYPEMISDIFRVMFEPVPSLARQVNSTMTKLGLVENEFVSSHVRARYPQAKLLEILGSLSYDIGGGLDFEAKKVKWLLLPVVKNAVQCGHVLAPDLKIFFVSDDNQVTNYAISHQFTVHDINDKESTIQPLGINRDKEPIHTEGSHNMTSSALDFYPVFEDLLIMGGSKCVAHGLGSFGSLGAGLGSNRCRAIHRNHFGKPIDCPNERTFPHPVVINASEMMFGEQPGGIGKLVYDESKYVFPTKK